MMVAVILASVLAAIPLAVLALFDPKRLRNLATRRRKPLPGPARGLLWAIIGLIGIALGFSSTPAGVLIWLGSLLFWGWLMALVAAPTR